MQIKCPVILPPSLRKNSNGVIFPLEYVPQLTKFRKICVLSWWHKRMGQLVSINYSSLFQGFITRFCILPSKIVMHVVPSRCNFTIKWVHFINVLWYKEARSLTDFCHKISTTIISEFSILNAKQKQTGNWNYGYDLHLTVFLLFLNSILK